MFRGGRNCIIGIFAIAMGAGILIAAIFPTGLLMFLSGNIADRQRLCLLEAVERRGVMNIVVWKAPKAMRGLLRKLFRIQA
ncbi:MAG: hypothetical protein ACLU38_03590 [Dysosmobacter sp.]